MLNRIRRGEPFPDPYAYGSRPLREEIVQYVDGARSAQPRAVVTRNSHGVLALNTARTMFLDVDVGPAGAPAAARAALLEVAVGG
ncbi:MAG: hypothetical protein DMD78_26770 [Candidatus Rokuibacteriota bacterium]|nr:MAG: hypothetical protein DMD78_26770 [Candidatus Rokubacteria bacterium]